MEKKTRMEISDRINMLSSVLKKEKAELDFLAGETVRLGRTLSGDAHVLQQNEKVNALIVETYQLEEMLKQYDEDIKR